MKRRSKGAPKLISCIPRLSPAALQRGIGLPWRNPGTPPVRRNTVKELNRWQIELITQAT